MFTRKTFLILVAALTAVSTANANLILTLNGSDISNSPLIIQGVGELLVAIRESTPFGPNDLSVEASGGFWNQTRMQTMPTTLSLIARMVKQGDTQKRITG